MTESATAAALAQLETLQQACTGAHLVLPVLSESTDHGAWLLKFVDDCATHRVGVTVCVRSTVDLSALHANLRQRQVPVVDVRISLARCDRRGKIVHDCLPHPIKCMHVRLIATQILHSSH